jgi:integrase
MSTRKRKTKNGYKWSFTFRYKDIFGNVKQYTSPGYDTQKEAKLEEAKKRIEISENKTNNSNLTFNQIFLEYVEYRKQDMKIQSIKKLENLYKVFEPIGEVKINDYDLGKHKQFRLYIEQKDYSIAYKNKIIGLLKRLIKHSNKYYNTNDTILNFIDNFREINKFKKEMQFFTYDEFQKFISVIEEFNYKTFFETLYYLGLRQGECTALTWNDINFQKKEVSINKTLTTKLKGQLYTISSPKTVNSNRTIPIPHKLIKSYEILKEKAKTKKYFSEDWFVFGDELPFRETTIQKRKNKYCELAGVKQIRIHDFRHSCASFLIQNGASIVLVSKYLGHSKISVTLDTYTHLYKSELLEVSKLIDTL